MMARIRLHLKKPKFVTTEQDIDTEVPERTLGVDSVVFDKAVALAGANGFRPPGRGFHCRHMLPAEVASFARSVRQGLASETQEPTTKRWSQSPTPQAQMRDFFNDAGNRRALIRILNLVEQGGELVAEDL